MANCHVNIFCAHKDKWQNFQIQYTKAKIKLERNEHLNLIKGNQRHTKRLMGQ